MHAWYMGAISLSVYASLQKMCARVRVRACVRACVRVCVCVCTVDLAKAHAKQHQPSSPRPRPTSPRPTTLTTIRTRPAAHTTTTALRDPALTSHTWRHEPLTLNTTHTHTTGHTWASSLGGSHTQVYAELSAAKTALATSLTSVHSILRQLGVTQAFTPQRGGGGFSVLLGDESSDVSRALPAALRQLAVALAEHCGTQGSTFSASPHAQAQGQDSSLHARLEQAEARCVELQRRVEQLTTQLAKQPSIPTPSQPSGTAHTDVGGVMSAPGSGATRLVLLVQQSTHALRAACQDLEGVCTRQSPQPGELRRAAAGVVSELIGLEASMDLLSTELRKLPHTRAPQGHHSLPQAPAAGTPAAAHHAGRSVGVGAGVSGATPHGQAAQAAAGGTAAPALRIPTNINTLGTPVMGQGVSPAPSSASWVTVDDPNRGLESVLKSVTRAGGAGKATPMAQEGLVGGMVGGDSPAMSHASSSDASLMREALPATNRTLDTLQRINSECVGTTLHDPYVHRAHPTCTPGQYVRGPMCRVWCAPLMQSQSPPQPHQPCWQSAC